MLARYSIEIDATRPIGPVDSNALAIAFLKQTVEQDRRQPAACIVDFDARVLCLSSGEIEGCLRVERIRICRRQLMHFSFDRMNATQ